MKLAFAPALALLACGPPTPPPQPRPVPRQPAPETRPATAAIQEPPPAPEPPPPPPPPPPPDRIVRITVVSAENTATMTNGEEWDAKGAPPPAGVPAPILRHLEQHPELADTWSLMGVPLDDAKLIQAADRSPAPDPMVIIEIGNTVFRSPVRPRQFNPVWDFPLSFLYGSSGARTGVPIGAVARFQVVDYDGPNGYDSMGATLVPVDTLLGSGVHTFGPFGNVRKLVVTVTSEPVPAAEPPPLQHRLAVSGNMQWTDTGIDLVAGQRVEIEAADEVCSKGGSLDHCSGPEGQRRTSSYNVDGFAKLGHGALIGALGDTRFPVRRTLTMVAPSSGRLRLGINDNDTRDNRGSYAVRVSVYAQP